MHTSDPASSNGYRVLIKRRRRPSFVSRAVKDDIITNLWLIQQTLISINRYLLVNAESVRMGIRLCYQRRSGFRLQSACYHIWIRLWFQAGKQSACSKCNLRNPSYIVWRRFGLKHLNGSVFIRGYTPKSIFHVRLNHHQADDSRSRQDKTLADNVSASSWYAHVSLYE